MQVMIRSGLVATVMKTATGLSGKAQEERPEGREVRKEAAAPPKANPRAERTAETTGVVADFKMYISQLTEATPRALQ